jgi:hypothetical protein
MMRNKYLSIKWSTPEASYVLNMAQTSENVEHNTGARKDNIFLSTRCPQNTEHESEALVEIQQHWLYQWSQQHYDDDSNDDDGYNRD